MTLTACNPKPSSTRSEERRGSDVKTTASCQGSEFSTRVLNSSASFQQTVGDLVSAVMDPLYLGDISGASSGVTGVTVTMKLVFDAQKQIVPQSSRFEILIKDSWVGDAGTDGEPILAIEILHDGTSQLSGSLQGENLQLHFSDEYGSIDLSGQVRDGLLQGTISFVNSRSWDNSAPRSGTLGQIQVSSCSF